MGTGWALCPSTGESRSRLAQRGHAQDAQVPPAPLRPHVHPVTSASSWRELRWLSTQLPNVHWQQLCVHRVDRQTGLVGLRQAPRARGCWTACPVVCLESIRAENLYTALGVPPEVHEQSIPPVPEPLVPTPTPHRVSSSPSSTEHSLPGMKSPTVPLCAAPPSANM